MEKLTIYHLTKHYVIRYGLPTDNRAGTSANADDGMQAYHRYFERLLENTPVGEISLYDAMVPVDGGPRVISTDEFERYCLPRLAGYIQKNYDGQHNEEVLREDLERWQLDYDKNYWAGRAQEIKDRTLEALQNGEYNPPMEDDGLHVATEEEVTEKGHWLMVEAIFHALYDEFKWDKLRDDLDASKNTPVSDDPLSDIPSEWLRAVERLKDHRNYVVKRKAKK